MESKMDEWIQKAMAEARAGNKPQAKKSLLKHWNKTQKMSVSGICSAKLWTPASRRSNVWRGRSNSNLTTCRSRKDLKN